MIKAEDFSFTYPVPRSLQKEGRADFFQKRALDRVSLTIESGEFLLLTGGSGSGKSSLLLALSGMIPHVTGGKIGGKLAIGGKEIRSLNPSLLAETTGAAFQNPHTQLLTPSVREEVAFPLQNRGIPRGEMLRRIEKSLEFTGLTGLEDRNPRDLSGGEKQRLLLAVLIAWDPPVFLLDEPLSALDPAGAEAMMELLIRLNREQGKTIILAEKNLEYHKEGIGRVFHMDYGRIIEKPIQTESDFFSFKSSPQILKEELPSLEISRISFAYPQSSPIFEDFSLSLKPGEVLALSGVNGSGKTTLASLIMGVLKPQKGAVKLGQLDLTSLSVAERARHLGYLFQNPDHQLFCPTVREELAFGGHEKAVEEALSYFKLIDYAELPPALLSFALRKRVALASVYAENSPFYLLDEPDWGQDRDGLEGIIRFVGEEKARGKGFLLISHNRRLVEALADREITLPGGHYRV
ncbi:MAG: ABC transporter ATP-binding protein [Spirochaetales bacterium]|nr:ABC transporter ATP-binding protein [Spirochaetales bacterium]